MKGKLILFVGFFSFLAMAIVSSYFFIGELALLLNPLDERVRLIGYPAYVVGIAAAAPFSIWIVAGLGYGIMTGNTQPLAPTGGRVSRIMYNGMLVTVAIFLVLGLSARIYQGQRIDSAGYVQCKGESSVSLRASWRVYAVSPELCKDS